jgi:WD40 repeat protein
VQAIRDARLSPSGIRFHTTLEDHTVRIWDSFTGEAGGRGDPDG